MRLPLLILILFQQFSWAEIDFAADINPIFVQHCTACHGGVKKEGGLSFVYREEALAKGESGLPSIVPGKPEDSELLRRISLPADDDEVMPKASHGPPLPAHDIELIRQWIEEGAEWSGHWSFTPVKDRAGSIDEFVEKQRQENGLDSSPVAPRAEWLRRVTLDLTGLLPTLEELAAFENDASPDAFEKVVTNLLDSSSFGERWASVWLDVARYADSEGLGIDKRREVYPYRNWVIRAFNDDLPYDQFLIKQIAGDLLADPTIDDFIATGFNRLSPQNSEGGTDDEEFRVAAVMDRTATTWNAFQGLTMECVQCHSHPYDPIRHEDYYRTFAFFNNTSDQDTGPHDVHLKIPDSVEAQKQAVMEYLDLQKKENEFLTDTLALDHATAWQAPVGAEFSTKGSELKAEVRTADGGAPDFHSTGTPGVGAVHTVTFEASKSSEALTALKLTVLPNDLEAARHLAEASFSLAELKLTRIAPDGSRTTIPFQNVVTNSARDDLGALQNIIADPPKNSWTVSTKFFHPRWAAFVLKEPLALAPGERLEVVLTHTGAQGNSGSVPLVIRRFQLHLTSDPVWQSDAVSPERRELAGEIKGLASRLGRTKGPRTLIMEERERSFPRETRVFERGNWLTRGEVVTPGTPASLPLLENKNPTRLDLARWMASENNPLTARVWVNRVWHQLFGTGLVETLEDFGAAGMRPTHPDLLDALAHRFMHADDWSTKALLREIVLSKTYRQTAQVSAETRAKDPQNIWLSYGPRQRLTAEMMRDTALQAAGLLSHKTLGALSFPPIPHGVWRPFDGGDQWKTPRPGEPERYRRMLYTYTKRELPYPSLATFDAPSREFCTQRRLPSNTPLQALTLLNGEVSFEAAAAFAKTSFPAGQPLADTIPTAYLLATSRHPDDETTRYLVEAHQTFLNHYRANPDLADQLESTPEEAARILLANVILNLDEFLTR